MRKIVINPAYEQSRETVCGVPSRFEHEGEVLYALRNCIKRIDAAPGCVWNVKSYKVPHVINRVVYRHLRKSKARRAYENALRLLQMGVDTPTPIAYIVEQNAVAMGRSYYITEQIDFDYDMRTLLEERPADFDALVRGYVEFVWSFHRKGIYFVDLSTGNTLLVRQPQGGARYYLVDLNRATFHDRQLTCSEGVKGFCRLDYPWELKKEILHLYAQVSGYGVDEVMACYSRHARRDLLRRTLKDRGVVAYVRMLLSGGNF